MLQKCRLGVFGWVFPFAAGYRKTEDTVGLVTSLVVTHIDACAINAPTGAQQYLLF